MVVTMRSSDDIPLYLYSMDEDELRTHIAKKEHYDTFGHDGNDALKRRVRELEAELRGRKEAYRPDELVTVSVGGYDYLVPQDRVDEPKQGVTHPDADEGFLRGCILIYREWKRVRSSS